MRPARIEVEIDEVVLHGFPAGGGYETGEALRRELERLLAEGDAVSEGPARHSLDCGRIELTTSPKPDSVGAELAMALYEGLTR